MIDTASARARRTAPIATRPGIPGTTPCSGLISTTWKLTNTNSGPFRALSNPDQKVRNGSSGPALHRGAVMLPLDRPATTIGQDREAATVSDGWRVD